MCSYMYMRTVFLLYTEKVFGRVPKRDTKSARVRQKVRERDKPKLQQLKYIT